MSFSESDARLETLGQVVSPYVRQNRSTDLVLSTTWQRVVFNGTSTRNTNTFPLMDGTNRLVQWDAVNNVFDFNNPDARHYDVIFNFHINSSTLVSLLNLTMTTVKFRFVVPSPTPRYFPLPDDGGFADIAYTNLSADVRGTYNYIVRSVSDVEQYGIGVEMCIAGAALGTIKLVTGDISIYGR